MDRQIGIETTEPIDGEKARTIFCANLSDKVTEALLYELFLQGGPVERVHIPKDKDGRQRTFGFVTYSHLESVDYGLFIFNGTKLFNRELSLKQSGTSNQPNNGNNLNRHTQNQMQEGKMNPFDLRPDSIDYSKLLTSSPINSIRNEKNPVRDSSALRNGLIANHSPIQILPLRNQPAPAAKNKVLPIHDINALMRLSAQFLTNSNKTASTKSTAPSSDNNPFARSRDWVNGAASQQQQQQQPQRKRSSHDRDRSHHYKRKR